MQWLRSIAREVYGLFVDDGSFAVALLAWTLMACATLRWPHAGHWGGPILVVGFVVALAENALRSSRRRR